MGKIAQYKVGDKVLFTFLNEQLKGTITKKIDNFQFKVVDTAGYNYPFVYKKKPNAKEQVLSYIIKKI